MKSLREEFPSLIDRAYELFKGRRLVEDIMSKDVVTIPPEASMAEASRVMGANRIGSLIVEVERKPEGIITERDLLSKVLAKDQDPEKVRVQDVMSSPLITIEPTATIKAAAQTMISQKGRLAVFQQGELIGVITAADLNSAVSWRILKSHYFNPKLKIGKIFIRHQPDIIMIRIMH